MDPEHRERVKEILEQALERDGRERAGFLESLCDVDATVAREVASLLAHETDPPRWPEAPLLELLTGPAKDDPTDPLTLGQLVGPYRVERLLGRGGMGTVTLAVRENDFEKRVALKVLHTRLSGALVRRFHAERQILAQLEHPNIARILDGGATDDGRPFFAMELVEGEPIDQFCERRQLSLRERLELVLAVCSALELAHRNLVVHRDVKPSNVLVTPTGIPKLLDFSIAKRLDDDATELTRHEERPMTLRWASPEQIAGGPITTATDVYGLGTLLFQLLAGRHPFATDTDNDLELAAAIRETPAPNPSTVCTDPGRHRELAGDLDAILNKALRKEPAERYGSVAQLADDLRRHLEGRAVHARQGTWLYLAGRLARRHKAPLLAAMAVVLLSLLFGSSATLLWRRAEAQRRQALDAQHQKERSLELFKEVLRGADPNQAQGRQDLKALDLVREAEARLGDEDPGVQAELLATIGQVYASWGLVEAAGDAWRRAEKLLRERYPEGHPDLAKAINNVASWRLRRGDYAQAARLYRDTVALKERFPTTQEVDLAKSLSNLATALMEMGEYAEVETLYLRALEIRRRSPVPDLGDVGQSLRNLGVFYHERGELERAETTMREALKTFRAAYGSEEHTRFATTLNGLGRVVHEQGRYEEALASYLRALEIRQKLVGEDHLHVTATWLDLGWIYLDLGQVEKGRGFLEAARQWLATEPAESQQRLRARLDGLFGAYLAAEGRFEEAEPLLVTSYRQLMAGRRESDAHGRRAYRELAQLYTTWEKTERLTAVLAGAS